MTHPIKNYLNSIGQTGKELAPMLGIKAAQLSHIINGRNKLPPQIADCLELLTGVSALSWLFPEKHNNPYADGGHKQCKGIGTNAGTVQVTKPREKNNSETTRSVKRATKKAKLPRQRSCTTETETSLTPERATVLPCAAHVMKPATEEKEMEDTTQMEPQCQPPTIGINEGDQLSLAQGKRAKLRSDTISGEVSLMKSVFSGMILPPPHISITQEEMPFWASIMSARAKDSWTAPDLELAGVLARAKYKIETITKTIEKDGDIVDGRQHPLYSTLGMLIGKVESLSIKLHINANSTVGRGRDTGSRTKKEHELAGLVPDDDFLAKPMVQ